MKLVKIPHMKKKEYDQLITKEYISRIAFKGDKHPYIAPFFYVFDGQYMFFLATKYGKKIRYIQQNPHVSVEVEAYNKNLSDYKFVTLLGRLKEVSAPNEKKRVREKFVALIKEKNLSTNVLTALGYSPEDPLEVLVQEERTHIWKLVDVEEIIGFGFKDVIE